MISRFVARVLSPERYARWRMRELVREGIVEIGPHSYGSPHVLRFRNDNTKLKIGAFTSIGPGVTIVLGGEHPVDRITVFPLRERMNLDGDGTDGFPFSRGDIEIGSDVWIGANVTILSGVTIGNGAVVGAGSVVTRSVDEFAIASGVPAKPLRVRFPPTDRSRLAQLAWWTWPDDVILEGVGLLSDPGCSIDRLEEFARDRGITTSR